MTEIIEVDIDELIHNLNIMKGYVIEVCKIELENGNFGEARHQVGVIEGFESCIREIPRTVRLWKR